MAVRLMAHHYGADYQQYAHQHTLYDNTLYKDYYTPYTSTYPIKTGWDFYIYPIKAGVEFSSVSLEFHKDHTRYGRYKPTIIVDNVCIAKYIDPEPSHGVWGLEETMVIIERFQEEGTDFRETKFGAVWA